MVRTMFSQFGNNFRPAQNLQLRWSFGNTSILIDENGDGVNKYLRGLVTDAAGNPDRLMTSQVTQHLFEDSVGHSLDLAALNIQRGRDHGLPGYNQWRRWCNLPEALEFRGGSGGFVHHFDDVIRRLASIYDHPDDVDIFAGGMSEEPIDGGIVGPTFACIISHQFKALKIGDRFWYERDDSQVGFTRDQLNTIKQTTLAMVLCDNSNVEEIQPAAFIMANNRNQRINCGNLKQPSLRPWSDDPDVRNGNNGNRTGRNNDRTGNNTRNDNINRNNNSGWSSWGRWSKCRRSRRTRLRSCRSRSGCQGQRTQSQRCSRIWSQWSRWSRCSRGIQSRRRMCGSEGVPCPVSHKQVRRCRSNQRNNRRGSDNQFNDSGDRTGDSNQVDEPNGRRRTDNDNQIGFDNTIDNTFNGNANNDIFDFDNSDNGINSNENNRFNDNFGFNNNNFNDNNNNNNNNNNNRGNGNNNNDNEFNGNNNNDNIFISNNNNDNRFSGNNINNDNSFNDNNANNGNRFNGNTNNGNRQTILPNTPQTSWGEWEDWGRCSGGESERRRSCINLGGSGRSDCSAPGLQTRVCSIPNFTNCKKSIFKLFKTFFCQ